MSGAYQLYVAVYEHKGPILKGLTREFMRHTSVLVKIKENDFDVYHVQGTPGIGLRYHFVHHWSDPVEETTRLLSMFHVSDVAKNKYGEIDSTAKSVSIRVSKEWNCQDWVQELLVALTRHHIIKSSESEGGIARMREAINLPFTTETPNTKALDD